MIAAEIQEDDYRIGYAANAFWPVGEWGPLACGCCLVALEFDPVGPRLCLVMQRITAKSHAHELGDFRPLVLEAEPDIRGDDPERRDHRGSDA